MTQAPITLRLYRPLRRLGLTAMAMGLCNMAPAAHAQDTSRIARVTVYPGSATVERVARVPAGARKLTLACLPASLDAQSLQINADPAVRVGEFNVLTEDRDVVTACASPLDGRVRDLEDQIAGVKAEASALQLVDGYLRSVASTHPAEEAAQGRAASPTPAQITATAEVLRKSGQDAFTRTHQLKRKQEALELSLKPLVAERDRVASQRARVVSVTIHLATEREAELRLSYQVRGPGWQPSYRATLDATKATVLIERQALVAQNSGEDWGNVQLTLSTGQPGRATQGQLPRHAGPVAAPLVAECGAATAKPFSASARHGHGARTRALHRIRVTVSQCRRRGHAHVRGERYRQGVCHRVRRAPAHHRAIERPARDTGPGESHGARHADHPHGPGHGRSGLSGGPHCPTARGVACRRCGPVP